MSKVAIVTDSNSGITQSLGKEMGIFVIPMPFTIDGNDYFEDINLSQEEFYEKLENDYVISTSQPAPGTVTDLWDGILKDYDEIVHIPMSSGLSGATQTALMLSEDYDGKVHVVDNRRISVTQKQSVNDALKYASEGMNGEEIKNRLEAEADDSSIYIMMDTLKYLKSGGRMTAAVATIGSLLKIKPVLQIQGEKLDAFNVARTVGQAKTQMINQMSKDLLNRFGSDDLGTGMNIFVAYTKNKEEADRFLTEVKERFPNASTDIDPLSLSVSCHIGPGALAIACTRETK